MHAAVSGAAAPGASPRAFLSYSWDGPEHRDWVLALADTLVAHGVDVTLDQYDAQPGDDRFAFMERLRAADVVVCVCTPTYVQKADARQGGVGIETTIITPAIYEGHPGKRYIPVIRASTDGVPLVPIYLQTRFFVDMRDDARAAEKVDELVGAIYNRPTAARPALGTAPAFPDRAPRTLLTPLTGPAGVTNALPPAAVPPADTPVAGGSAAGQPAPSPAFAPPAELSAADVMRRVLGSAPSDWQHFEAEELFVYQPDLHLTIAATGGDDNAFDEPWVREFSDPRAFRFVYEVRWSATPIRRITLIAVDGHRVLLPLPRSSNRPTITDEQDRFARLMNGFMPYGPRYAEYRDRAGIQVVPTTAPRGGER